MSSRLPLFLACACTLLLHGCDGSEAPAVAADTQPTADTSFAQSFFPTSSATVQAAIASSSRAAMAMQDRNIVETLGIAWDSLAKTAMPRSRTTLCEIRSAANESILLSTCSDTLTLHELIPSLIAGAFPRSSAAIDTTVTLQGRKFAAKFYSMTRSGSSYSMQYALYLNGLGAAYTYERQGDTRQGSFSWQRYSALKIGTLDIDTAQIHAIVEAIRTSRKIPWIEPAF